jgi:nicotinic acid mononucleotide adenylyltransferase
LLEDVHQNVSATAIRQAVVAKRPLVKFVSPAVAEYIKKMELYRE